MGLFDDNKVEFDPDSKPEIELVFYPKDAQGRVIGSPKTVKGDGFQVWRGWMNGNGPGNKHRKKDKSKTKRKPIGRYKIALPRGKEADKLAKEAAKYAEDKQTVREEKENQKDANV